MSIRNGLTVNKHRGGVANADALPLMDGATRAAAEIGSRQLLAKVLTYGLQHPEHVSISPALMRARLAEL